MSPTERDEFEERVAIMQYDGGLTPAEAMSEAVQIIPRKRKARP